MTLGCGRAVLTSLPARRVRRDRRRVIRAGGGCSPACGRLRGGRDSVAGAEPPRTPRRIRGGGCSPACGRLRGGRDSVAGAEPPRRSAGQRYSPNSGRLRCRSRFCRLAAAARPPGAPYHRQHRAGRHRLFAAEGLWVHWVLLDLGMPVELSLWCLESGLPKKARGDRAARPAACRRVRSSAYVSANTRPAWSHGGALSWRPTASGAASEGLPGHESTRAGGRVYQPGQGRAEVGSQRVQHTSRGARRRVPECEFVLRRA